MSVPGIRFQENCQTIRVLALIGLVGRNFDLWYHGGPRLIIVERGDVTWQISGKRALAAQAALRGIVLHAMTIRKTRDLGETI